MALDGLRKILADLGFYEIIKKLRTGGSGLKLSYAEKRSINVHKPHQVKQLLEKRS